MTISIPLNTKHPGASRTHASLSLTHCAFPGQQHRGKRPSGLWVATHPGGRLGPAGMPGEVHGATGRRVQRRTGTAPDAAAVISLPAMCNDRAMRSARSITCAAPAGGQTSVAVSRNNASHRS